MVVAMEFTMDWMREEMKNWAAELTEQTLTNAIQKSRVGRRVTNFTYWGHSGGSLLDVDEMVVSGYIPLGFRRYDTEKGEGPLERLSEVLFEDNIPGNAVTDYESGTLVKRVFDPYFEAGGSAHELTNWDYEELEDTETIRTMFMEEDIRYSLAHGIRRPLLGPDGQPSGIEVIDMKRARGYKGFFRLFDLKGYDWGRMWWRTVQKLIYRVSDFFFDRYVERPFKAMKERGFIRRLDPLVNSQYRITGEIANRIFGLPVLEKSYV
jgi:hypothetical protein